jgi:beta-glucosidase
MNPAPRRPRHLDPRLPLAQRVEALVSQMTLREKVAQMLHRAPPIPRLGVPAYNWWNECLHGVARAGRATVFPQAMGLAATFDDALVGGVARAISDEARAKHHDALRMGSRGQYLGLTYWTPNVNIFRDPRWGRGQETYGEDPYLTARMGVAFVRGLQGSHPRYLKLVATPKHFAVHSGPEPLRHGFDAVVSPRDLRETYLPAFEACVREGRAASVMGAYNRTNGEPCCGSRALLGGILRGEWGFDGYVVSDCWAIKDFHEHHKVAEGPEESVAMAVREGCDLNCGDIYPRLVEAVRRGLVSEEEVTRSVSRLFAARFRLGMFDPPARVPFSRIPVAKVACAAHRRLALRAARESIVLLKNNGILPLRKDAKHLVVAGPNALEQAVLLGNYNGFAPRMTSVLEGVLGKVRAGTVVNWSRGCELSGDRPIITNELDGFVLGQAPVDAAIATLGYSAFLEGEEGCSEGDGDRHRYGLPGRQQEYLEHLKSRGWPIVLVVASGSPVDLGWAKEHCDAILFAGYPGEAGGEAVADALFGDYNPAGRLPITFPKSYEQLPPFEDYAMKGRTYRFMEAEPLYRFGHGLSYTTFAYAKLRVPRAPVKGGAEVEVSVEVRNAGKRAGDEVVQLYLSDLEASVPVPRWHLEGFRRVHLRAGAKRVVRFRLAARQLAAFDGDGRPFVEPGEFRVSVGGGQPDDPAAGAVSATFKVA